MGGGREGASSAQSSQPQPASPPHRARPAGPTRPSSPASRAPGPWKPGNLETLKLAGFQVCRFPGLQVRGQGGSQLGPVRPTPASQPSLSSPASKARRSQPQPAWPSQDDQPGHPVQPVESQDQPRKPTWPLSPASRAPGTWKPRNLETCMSPGLQVSGFAVSKPGNLKTWKPGWVPGFQVSRVSGF